ncbi:MAG: hypothetical protein NPIRA02_24960 [Nitrospirales bacterium]|nr:MAG: hypothetical protein NPIRA02_24960 [Nitrospirales bacterium]
MKNIHSAVTLSIGMLVTSFTLPAWAGVEPPIELNAIPATIMQQAQEQFPDATFGSANTETEPGGNFVYEIQGILQDGRKLEYDVNPSGEIQEVEIEFQSDMVPGAVMKAIQKNLPGFTPTFIEASHSASMQVVGYEFVGQIGKNTIDINVSADGSKIEISDK